MPLRKFECSVAAAAVGGRWARFAVVVEPPAAAFADRSTSCCLQPRSCSRRGSNNTFRAQDATSSPSLRGVLVRMSPAVLWFDWAMALAEALQVLPPV